MAYGFLRYVQGGIGWVRRLACFKHGPDMDVWKKEVRFEANYLKPQAA